MPRRRDWPEIKSWLQADTLFKSTRGAEARGWIKLHGIETRLCREEQYDYNNLEPMTPAYAVQYFHTCIVSFQLDGNIELRSNGYAEHVSTKHRLNEYTPNTLHFHNKGGVCYVSTPAGEFRFVERMTILRDGSVAWPDKTINYVGGAFMNRDGEVLIAKTDNVR